MNWLYRLRHRPWRRDVKFFWQRITRGFSDEETWNLDSRLSELILPRLKRFKEVNMGYPPDISWEEWQIILDKMILAHEWYATDCSERNESVEYYAKVAEGMELFSKFYGMLWW